MNRAASIVWFLKAATVCAFVLAFCWATPRLVADVPRFPAVTSDDAQSAIADRYFRLPVADVALTGSSLTMRLREELFHDLSVRNFALPGGSPLTGAAVIEAAASVRPRFVAIETNILSRATDLAMVDRFRKGNARPREMLKPFRTIAALYQRELDNREREDPRQREREEALLKAAPASRDDGMPIASALPDWNRQDYDRDIHQNAAELKHLVEMLEQDGVSVFLYELPVDPMLEQSHYAKTVQAALAETFGARDPRWLSLQYPADELRWPDRQHLDDRSAIIMARSLQRSLLARMSRPGVALDRADRAGWTR